MSEDTMTALGGEALTTTTDDLQGLLYIDVWSATKPNLAGLTGLSRAAAYAAVARGEFPGVVKGGRRVRLHVPTLLGEVA